MTPADPRFADRVRDSFARQAAMHTLGATLASVKPGRTISVVEGRALQCEADGTREKLVATMSATVMTVTGRDTIQH